MNRGTLTSAGIGGLFVFAGLTYNVEEIQDINDTYLIETEAQTNYMWQGLTFQNKEDLQIRYKTRTYTAHYGNHQFDEGGATLTKTSESLGALSGYEIVDTSEYFNMSKRTSAPSTYETSEYIETYTDTGTITVILEYYNPDTGQWVSMNDVRSSWFNETNTTINKNITIDDFGVIEDSVAFGESYYLLLDIENEYNYDITKAMINGEEINMAEVNRVGNTEMYNLRFTNNKVSSEVLELLHTTTIEQLYVNGAWLDIEDITAEHILRTIDNAGYEEDIKYLQNEIDALNDDLNNINNQITTAQTNLNFIDQQISEGTGDLEQLNADKVLIEDNIAELETEKAELQGLIISYNQVIAEKEEMIEAREEQINTLKDELARLEEERLSKRPWYKKLFEWPGKVFNAIWNIPGNIVDAIIPGRKDD